MEAHDKYRIVQEIFNSIYQHNDSANAVKILESGFEAIRAEALKEAADRAVEYCKQFEGFFEGEDDIGLRAAIYAGEEKE